MRTKHLYIFTLVVSIIALFSCSNDKVDNTLPLINIVSPSGGDTLQIGSEIHFECTFSDNIRLKSYKIEIHSNFDDHIHEKSISELKDSVVFSYSNSWNFDEGLKNTLIHHHEIVIPDSISGKPVCGGDYHFGIYCADDSGNESHLFLDIVLEGN